MITLNCTCSSWQCSDFFSSNFSDEKNCTGFPFLNVLNTKLLVCVLRLKMVSDGSVYIFILLHVCTLSGTLHSSCDTHMPKIQQYKHKTHGFHTFSCFGPHTWNSHMTLDTAQPCHLLKPNWKPSSSYSILPQITSIPSLRYSLCVCVCVCVCVCAYVRACMQIMTYVNCFGRTVF